MLVNVLAVLNVTVAIVDVVNVVVVLDGLAAVPLRVAALVVGMQGLLGMMLVAVHVVDVVVVLDRLAPVARMVLVTDRLSVGSNHLSSTLHVSLVRADAGRGGPPAVL